MKPEIKKKKKKKSGPRNKQNLQSVKIPHIIIILNTEEMNSNVTFIKKKQNQNKQKQPQNT